MMYQGDITEDSKKGHNYRDELHTREELATMVQSHAYQNQFLVYL